MKRIVLALIASLCPLPAHAAGSGGGFFEMQYLPRYARPGDPHEAPGWVGCVGGMGYGVSRKNLRVGGEGAWCSGSNGDVKMGYGGAQIGRWYRAGFLYLSFYGSVGIGAMVDRKVLAYQDDPYTSVFLYGKPTFSIGLPLGFMGIETGVFANFPINLVQFVGPDARGRGIITPTVGVQVAVTFGNFRAPKKDRALEAQPPVVEPDPDCRYHPDCTAPPEPPQEPLIPEVLDPSPTSPPVDDRPLAIPER